MELLVDHSQRYAKMRAHTATHLLHAALAKYFPNTKQAGSLVDSDFLRFDFYADRLLTQEEISTIEKRINQIIYLACDVKIEEMKIEEASKLGAKMFFEEKYGDVVRVVQVYNKELPLDMKNDDVMEYFSSFGEKISVELCGGTHVSNTKDIGAFTIISQEAVASGIKRLTAFTGPKVIEKISDYTDLLSQLIEMLDVKSFSQLPEKIQKLLKDYNDTKSHFDGLEEKMVRSYLISGEKKSNSDFDVIMNLPIDMNFKLVGVLAKQIFPGKNVLLGTSLGNFILLTPLGESAKELAQKLGLKGGGNDNQVQGRDEKIMELI